MTYVDAIIHIADVPALLAWFMDHDPSVLNEECDTVCAFARTPTAVLGDQALCYVRVTPEDEAAFAAAPGLTILSRAEYAGPSTPDVIYSALFADAEAKAIYDTVYPRTPYQVNDEVEGIITITPPERFGVMG